MINPFKFFTRTEYTVACRMHSKDLLEDAETPFTVFPLQKGYWIADPFAFYYQSEYYIFMEVFLKERGYAAIGCSKIENGKMTEPKVILDEGTHMSFPDVFIYRDKIYMAPENCQTSKIRLYECEHFPDRWKEVPSEIDGVYCDTTIWENKEGELLAFSSLPGSVLYGSKLYLLKLKIEEGRLKVETQKQITEDSRYARQGGRMIRKGDRLYRVAQDCSGMEYGKALSIMEVTEESYAQYAEKFDRKISVRKIPKKGKIPWRQGIHTYNRAGQLDVIDFKVGIFSLKMLSAKVRFALQMLFRKG